MTCIKVDNPTSLFLTDNFVVTHNTRVLTERIRHLLEVKKVNPQDIVAITFTRLAAQEMHKRLGKIAEGVFIGTIHSYAKSICDLNGIDVQMHINNEQFDKILEEATFIPLNKYPKVKHLLVDECQDVTELEQVFLNCIQAENDFYVGDDRQEIYSFKGSSDEFLRTMFYSPRYANYSLIYNYRNAPNIIEFANNFLGSYNALSEPATAVKWQNGYIEEGPFSDCVTALLETNSYNSWAILCRTNAQIEYVQDKLIEMGIPYATFKRADLELEDLDAIMAENRVKILTIHVAKGLEWPNVIVVGAQYFNLEERKISYVAATRAQDNLYWCPSPIGRKRGVKKRTYKDGRLKSKTVFDSDIDGVIKF